MVHFGCYSHAETGISKQRIETWMDHVNQGDCVTIAEHILVPVLSITPSDDDDEPKHNTHMYITALF
jgi:hypothetical protein